MKQHILISNKEDWITKSEGKIDTSKFDITYSPISEQKSFRKFDAVIPLYETEVHYLNDKFKSKNGVKFIIPKNSVSTICEDKKNFSDFMNNHGFTNYTPLVSDSLSIPFILKKRIDEWGHNAFLIQNEVDLETYKAQLVSQDYFKQEYFFGKEEFTTHFLFKNGELKYYFTLKFEFKNDSYVKGRQSPPFKTATITEHKTDFISLFTDILKALEFEGVGCFDYKLNKGVPKIFEINPRVGGSLPLDANNYLENYIDQLKPTFFQRLSKSIFNNKK